MSEIVRKSLLAALWVIVACLIQVSVSEVSQGFEGDQFISQECAPHSRKQLVKVTDVSLVCDSQNNANGDEAYTDNPTCRTGDQAKIAIAFKIRRMSGDVDIYFDIDSVYLGNWHRVQNQTNVCDLAALAYWGENDDSGDDMYAQAATAPCPLRNGPYTIFLYFTVPYYINDVDFAFIPDLRIRFYTLDKDVGERKNIGCVETGTLGEIAFNRGRERKGERFFVISILSFCLIFALCLLGHRRTRRHGNRAKMKHQASMMRRFHYIQSTRSGEMGIGPSSSSMSGSFSHARPPNDQSSFS